MKKIRITLFVLLLLPLIAQARTMKVFGTLTDTDGKPVQGVTVSDGFTAVQTDAKGFYSFVRNEAAYYVHYSIPSYCEVPLRYGSPSFFTKLDRDSVYNFVLKRNPKGVESRFNLFFMADPQCQNVDQVRRFHNETVQDMRKMVEKTDAPSYGITLGDIAYTEGEYNTTYILPMMREEMKKESIGIPVFQTIGNHDFIYEGLALNPQNPTPKVRYARQFEDEFGPVNYSWNRGKTHIVSMNSVMYTKLNNGAAYTGGFTDEELEWLRQDLQFVPKDYLLVFCCHNPFYDIKNRDAVLGILAQFPHCNIYTGHIHTNTCYEYPKGIKEYNLAAASGCWWWSRNNADGTPNGYSVVGIDGGKVVSQLWKSTGFAEDHQIRIYQGDCVFGGKYERFQMPYKKNEILANVFAWDDDWKVEVYENGKLMGEMKHLPVTKDYSPEANTSKDWWAIGYNVGVVGRGHIGTSHRKNYCGNCSHMFYYKKKKANGQIKVVATDAFGRRYESSEIMSGDAMNPASHIYDEAVPPKYEPLPGW